MISGGRSPVPLVVYGVPFHNVTLEEAIDWIVDRVKSGRPASIATVNLDFVTKAWDDPELQRVLIDADLVLADGFPLVKLASFFGPKLKARVTGSDLTPMLAERVARNGMSIYGLGGADGVAKKAMEILKERHPELRVAGTHSPSYAPLLEMDHRKILQLLEKARPDILFVALGSPKQDKFIRMHVRDWNVPISIGVGASLDFITGDQNRAPILLQACSLEWLWRICSNPKRLFGRYIADIRFLLFATRQMILIHYMADKPVSCESLKDTDIRQLEEFGVVVERFPGLEDEVTAAEFIMRINSLISEKTLVLDLRSQPWLDSLELGSLLEINKFSRAQDKRLILYAPRSKVRCLLETCRLTNFFNLATRVDEIERLVKNLDEHINGGSVYEEGVLMLELPIELTVATLPSFEKETLFIHHKLPKEELLRRVQIDASQLDFIDSSGLDFLIRLKKVTQDNGMSMSIINLSSKPRRTFEIAQLDKVLLHV